MCLNTHFSFTRATPDQTASPQGPSGGRSVRRDTCLQQIDTFPKSEVSERSFFGFHAATHTCNNIAQRVKTQVLTPDRYAAIFVCLSLGQCVLGGGMSTIWALLLKPPENTHTDVCVSASDLFVSTYQAAIIPNLPLYLTSSPLRFLLRLSLAFLLLCAAGM